MLTTETTTAMGADAMTIDGGRGGGAGGVPTTEAAAWSVAGAATGAAMEVAGAELVAVAELAAVKAGE
jgi:hypothetical protein